MGQAKLKEINSGKIVKFDFSAPDIVGLPENEQAKRGVVVNVIASIVKAAFPQGLDRRDGRIWAAWQEDLMDDEAMEFDVTMGQVDWLLKHVGNETLKVDPGMAQAREAIAEYLTSINKAAPEAS